MEKALNTPQYEVNNSGLKTNTQQAKTGFMKNLASEMYL